MNTTQTKPRYAAPGSTSMQRNVMSLEAIRYDAASFRRKFAKRQEMASLVARSDAFLAEVEAYAKTVRMVEVHRPHGIEVYFEAV
jgi:hypothetical protein